MDIGLFARAGRPDMLTECVRSLHVSRLMLSVAALIPVVLGAVVDGAEFPLACTYVADAPMAEFEPYAQCAALAGDVLTIAKTHLKRMHFATRGLASMWVDGKWYYVKRTGEAVSVMTSDNGPDYFSEGLTRALVNGKVAYYDSSLHQRIRPRYDWGWPFAGGRALVCLGCRPGVPDDDGHFAVSGGLWGYIDKSGAEIIPVTQIRGEVWAE